MLFLNCRAKIKIFFKKRDLSAPFFASRYANGAQKSANKPLFIDVPSLAEQHRAAYHCQYRHHYVCHVKYEHQCLPLPIGHC